LGLKGVSRTVGLGVINSDPDIDVLVSDRGLCKDAPSDLDD